MRRETLAAIRDRIETLATTGGDYYVVCGRTGQRPVPVRRALVPGPGDGGRGRIESATQEGEG